MSDATLYNYPKQISTAYVLLGLLGVVGAHRFYIRSYGLGVVYLFTLGLFGIGIIVDLFILADRTNQVNKTIITERQSQDLLTQ